MIFKRDTYQNGSLYKEKRKAGEVWCFRWREIDAQGNTIHRKNTLGTLKELPTRAAANKAAASLRVDVNRGASRARTSMTVDDLVAHYLLRELPAGENAGGPVPKAHSTTVAYRRYLTKWILPRWGVSPIDSLAPIRVEEWLGSLPLANGSRVKIRNIMSAVFNHAIRHGFLPREEAANPMKYVRQSASSDTLHTVLSSSQVGALLAELKEHVRVMVLLDAFTGLRRSELLALRWGHRLPARVHPRSARHSRGHAWKNKDG